MKLTNVVVGGRIISNRKRSRAENNTVSCCVKFYGSTLRFHKNSNCGTYMLFLCKNTLEIIQNINLYSALRDFIIQHFQKPNFYVKDITCHLFNAHLSLHFEYKGRSLFSNVIKVLCEEIPNTKIILSLEQHDRSEITLENLILLNPNFYSIDLRFSNGNHIRFQNNSMLKHTSATILIKVIGPQTQHFLSKCRELEDYSFEYGRQRCFHKAKCEKIEEESEKLDNVVREGLSRLVIL